jgi:membrane protein implicated in regulation of membrane protease activity
MVQEGVVVEMKGEKVLVEVAGKTRELKASEEFDVGEVVQVFQDVALR